MSAPVSKHLNGRQIAGINKVGDVLVPGEGDLPSFSESGCVRHVDRLLDYMPAQDLSDLKTLLLILGFLPSFLVSALLHFLELVPNFPGPLGAVFRMIRIGLRGVAMSLYYGDDSICDRIGYQVSVYTEDL